MKPEVKWPGEGGRPLKGYRPVQARLGDDGLLHTLSSDGFWEEWLPLKQAAETVAGLLLRLIIVGVCSFLLGMLAQWTKGAQ